MLREQGHRILLAGGGTGGHLYPGLALAEAVCRIEPGAAIAFTCTRRPIDRKVLAGRGYPFTEIDARPFNKWPWTWPGLVVSLVRSGNQARRRLREYCPDVVVGLGGYGSYAAVRIGQKYDLPTAIVNPDIVPGRANRRLARWVDLAFCQFQETVAEFGDRGRLTGCPIRPSLFGATRAAGLAEFGLDPARRTLLVTGASLGARTVNLAVLALLKDRGLPEGWQVLHLTGHGEYKEVARAYRESVNVPAVVRPYAEQMGLAYAASDLVVARAGASTIAEILAVGLPAIFIPYPFHRDQHQMRQARAVESLGAAVVVEDRPGDPATWRDLAQVLLAVAQDRTRLAGLAEKARAVGRPGAAEDIARQVLELAARTTEARHARIENDSEPSRPNIDRPTRAAYTRTGDTKA
ncbi:MAG: UDP-N-acetylglucosamine--N-acetylmuramyl-(pentapeptide) pyrophosphoryl-undecaprenol N-acetylglucosamine transferase [Planctomycetota bacterium]|nr:UDP-N-acetylglucosamine--N-acetylmuramyl-(pentapeptide) pyrophosphoryl-undecaprenol N-acetylglucosamine transferase [Planctomycetota bacterium]